MIEVKWKRFHPDALMPEYAYDSDSGADLRFFDKESAVLLWPGETRLLGTGIGIEMPPGWEAQGRPRSGLSSKGIRVSFGTIDNGYRGELLATVYNASKEQYIVRRGDKIVQLVFAPVHQARFVLVDELGASPRNTGGHGSTGR